MAGVMTRWGRALGAAMAALTMIVGLALPALADARVVLLYGDSVLAGLGLSEADGFMGQMQAAMDKAGLDAKLVNASVSGDTSADGLARLEWTLGTPADAVILGLGANDMLQGLPPAETRANLEAMLSGIDALDVPVLLLGMKANRGLGPDYVADFDAIYPALAAEHGALLDPFYLEGVALDPGLNQADGLHPNAKGVAVIVARLLPLVQQLLAEAG